MLSLLTRGRERKQRKVELDLVRRQRLRQRLYETLESVLDWLAHNHELTSDMSYEIGRQAGVIKRGIDVVLVQGVEANGKHVPEPLRGGAIIANSAEAFSSLAYAIDKPELEAIIGSINDKEITRAMLHQLGFARDGSMLEL